MCIGRRGGKARTRATWIWAVEGHPFVTLFHPWPCPPFSTTHLELLVLRRYEYAYPHLILIVILIVVLTRWRRWRVWWWAARKVVVIPTATATALPRHCRHVLMTWSPCAVVKAPRLSALSGAAGRCYQPTGWGGISLTFLLLHAVRSAWYRGAPMASA